MYDQLVIYKANVHYLLIIKLPPISSVEVGGKKLHSDGHISIKSQFLSINSMMNLFLSYPKTASRINICLNFKKKTTKLYIRTFL